MDNKDKAQVIFDQLYDAALGNSLMTDQQVKIASLLLTYGLPKPAAELKAAVTAMTFEDSILALGRASIPAIDHDDGEVDD